MRVNLGCGEFPLEGWLNVDAYHRSADVQTDMRKLNLENVSEVLMEHSLEHLSHRDVLPLLRRVHRWLVPGGTLRVEVPDMAEIMRRGQSDPYWLIYIYGAQAPNEWETHRSGFTEESLRHLLGEAGFVDVETRTFPSTHKWRRQMPCLEAHAVSSHGDAPLGDVAALRDPGRAGV